MLRDGDSIEIVTFVQGG
nr:hypothetical protein [Bifidobacterium crudilactis]